MLYKVNVTYEFKGHYVIEAESSAEAERIATEQCGTVLGGIQSTNEAQVKDWEFPSHPEAVVRNWEYV